MVELAVAGEPHLIASRLEVERGGTSFTLDTVHELRQRFPGQRFELLLGADAAAHVQDWHRADELLADAWFVIFNRPGTQLDDGALRALGFTRARTRMVQLQTPEVSAHEIRERLAAGAPIDGMVPAAVAEYIHARQLYAAPPKGRLG